MRGSGFPPPAGTTGHGVVAHSQLEVSLIHTHTWEHIVRRPCFDIYRTPSADGGLVVAKCARNLSEMYRRSLREEFSALQEVSRRCGDVLAGTIPRPIAFREKESMMLVTGISGTSLEMQLHWRANIALGWRNLAAMRQIGEALGDWVKRFQSSTAIPSEGHDHYEYLNRLDRTVFLAQEAGISEPCSSTCAVVPRRRVTRSKARPFAWLRRTEISCRKTFSSMGSSPESLISDNIVPWPPMYRDISTFLAYIAMLATKVQYSAKALAILSLYFLKGYGNQLDFRLLRVFILKRMLEIIGDSPEHANSVRRRRRIEKVILGVSDKTSWLDHSLERLLTSDGNTRPATTIHY